MNEEKFLKIKDLIELVSDNRIELPNVQRGFVWKPFQVENLWDSLLRKFPSGAIITSPIDENRYQLLDGQQRTTSIALGFADIWSKGEESEVFHASTKEIRIFIDMRKANPDTEGKAFAFRVITRSHPWGYQYADNAKPLETTNKSKALKLWRRDDPFADGILESVYPWDAVGPLPLNFFTRAALLGIGVEQLKQELLLWVQESAPGTSKEAIVSWLEDMKSSASGKPTRNFKTYSVEEMYEKVKDFVFGYVIPMLPLPDILSSGISANSLNKNNVELDSSDDIEKSDGDEIEQVFVRLNAGGTPLGGEELNYSIIKAKIDRDFQKKIEEKCRGIIRPARFITIAFRLYQQSAQEDSISLRIKPKQFQREMHERHKEFVEFIDEILKGELLEKVKSVLRYGERMDGYDASTDDYRLPYPLFLKIAAASQGEVMFILMYRLLFGRNGKPDSFKFGTNEHRKMIGIVLMFMWHGKDARGRYNKLLEKIWKNVKELPVDKMWDIDLVQKAKGENELKPIPSNLGFLNILDNVQKNTKIWNRYSERGNEGYLPFLDFIDNVMCNKDLLLWVQRKFLSTSPFFKEDLFRLDDTDVPFDWDHISAHNFIKNKREIADPLKDIYHQPCNFRAWPYRLNRADQDDVPARKFTVGDAEMDSILRNALPGLSDKQINIYLLENSFCGKDWKRFDDKWLDGSQIKGNWKDVYGLILGRWKEMYKQLFRELRLKDLAVR